MVSTSALATEPATPDTKSTTVKYAVTQGYEWTIHSDVTFESNKGVNSTATVDNQTVEVKKNIIPDGKKLNITVQGSGSNGAFEIANGNTKLTYKITEGENEILTGGTVLDVVAGTNTNKKNLKFTLTTGKGTAEVAGTYTGTVTYTASIINQTEN